MKRILCILCLLLVLVCVFAACSDEETPNTDNTNTDQNGGENNQQGGEQGEPHSHFYGMWKVTTAATCTAKGEETRACSCGDFEAREVAMLAHTYGEWAVTVNATCAVKGEEKRTCTCGAAEIKEIAVTGKHTYGEWSATVTENCVTDGTYKRACDCGAEETKTVPATGKHEYGVENTCVVCEIEMVYTKELLYEWSEDGSGYMVNGLDLQDATDVIIPPYHQKKPVIGVRSHAFDSQWTLSSITFPDSVRVIERDAFYDCPELIQIDNGVSYVGKWVVGCETRVKTVILRSNTVGIANTAFRDCAEITIITIPATVKHIGSLAFQGCTSLSWVTISEGVKEIGDYAFRNCTALLSVKIPKSAERIGKAPFRGCTALEHIEVVVGNTAYHAAGNCLIATQSKTLIAGAKNSAIPADGSVTSIASEAFADCTTLASIRIPNAIDSIGENAFSGCTALQYTVYEGGKYLGNGENPHLYLEAITDKTVTAFTIANTAKLIAPEVFKDCLSLTAITVPASVTDIGDRAFRHCVALESVTFEAGSKLERVGEEAFQGCGALKEITIPAAVISIGYRAFMDCDAVEAVIFEQVEGWSAVSGEHTKVFDGELGDPTIAKTYLTQVRLLGGYVEYCWGRAE